MSPKSLIHHRLIPAFPKSDSHLLRFYIHFSKFDCQILFFLLHRVYLHAYCFKEVIVETAVYRQEKGKYSESPWIKQQGGQKIADMIKVYLLIDGQYPTYTL
jgi:hypothetical protein